MGSMRRGESPFDVQSMLPQKIFKAPNIVDALNDAESFQRHFYCLFISVNGPAGSLSVTVSGVYHG